MFALLSAPAYFSGNPLLAAPPLLVTYTEFTRPDMTLRLKPRRAWGTLALAGLFGGVGRFAVESLGVPPTLVVALFYPLLIATWSTFETWLPPAGAALLLGLLVPYAGPLAYPASVAVGGAVWVTAAMAFPGIRPKAIERGRFPREGIPARVSDDSFRAGRNSPPAVTGPVPQVRAPRRKEWLTW